MIPLVSPTLSVSELPTTPFRAFGDWVLVLVESVDAVGGLHLVSRIDQHGEVGVGHVLAASKHRYRKHQVVLPKDLQKHDVKFTEPSFAVTESEVSRGDVVIFRRFLRAQRCYQPDIPLNFPTDKGKDLEYFCIHVDDIIGVRKEA